MNALAWNCQGLGNPGKFRFLKHLTLTEKPSFVFLSETISSYSKMEELCSKLGFEGFIAVEPRGKSGGIAMFWKNADNVNLLSLSQSHIDIVIKSFDKGEWRLTGIYGEPDRAQRHKTWDLLQNLSRDGNLPWCLMGDFNNVTSQADKKGGETYPNHLIEGFNSCLQDVELQDMDIIGHQFTWERGRNTSQWIEIRLDRLLVNAHWRSLFQMSKVYNIEETPSDHSPLLMIPEQQIGGLD
ncbi:Endo/exonuclease/phosphatase domain-containing protein [Heracleum sosnowskyi]|uniref:Endo/exonuclease/phosphatase domain-containing protein n=1 Tax=Heracleum sosnowskyi TaxID=360622 RepID=A0AAD8H1I6_9APIA|nr:Endo/exonuclease/phosphatase domain-containing protein [Heracleum sosnowskyi]